jgi:uncharacterized membrane protein YeaQ/YmgE (transglycosylase-associated protein family)
MKMNLLSDYGFLGWIVIGALAGIIAKAVMPGRDPGGCIVTILLGVAGAAVAGFLGNALGWYGQGEERASSPPSSARSSSSSSTAC